MVCDPSNCELLKLKSDFALQMVDKDFTDMSIAEKNECFSGLEPLLLVRECLRGKSVIGYFSFRGVYICDTLENVDYLIKEGVYRLDKSFSPKFNRPLYEIVGVPNRSRLLIHPGNYYYDSKGCVLVGIVPQDKAYINYSTVNLNRLHRIISVCSILSIKIVNCYE